MRTLTLLLLVAVCWTAVQSVPTTEKNHKLLDEHPSAATVYHEDHLKNKYPKKHSAHIVAKHKEAGAEHGKYAGGQNHHHNTESGKKGQQGHVHKSKKYDESTGKKHSHHLGDHVTGHYHAIEGAHHGAKFNDGKKYKKAGFVKGYREQYHKDEHKKHDSFYSNQEKKDEYHHFGEAHAKQHAHHHDKTANGKHKEGKFADKHGKEGKSHKEHDVKAHKNVEGGHSSESHYGKSNKWAKKNHHNHQ